MIIPVFGLSVSVIFCTKFYWTRMNVLSVLNGVTILCVCMFCGFRRIDMFVQIVAMLIVRLPYFNVVQKQLI